MNRRRFLASTGALSIPFAAGCTSNADTDDETPSETETPADPDNPSPETPSTEDPSTESPSTEDSEDSDDDPESTPSDSQDDETPEDDMEDIERIDKGGPDPIDEEDPFSPDIPDDADHVITVGPDGEPGYSPESLEVKTGEKVVWAWEINNSNVRPYSDAWPGTPGGEDDLYDRGNTFEYVFDTAGTYEYYCAYHLGMGGKVIVS